MSNVGGMQSNLGGPADYMNHLSGHNSNQYNSKGD